MFSGIVEEIGKLQQVSDSSDGRRLRICCSKVISGLKIGDSISVSGTCLTVVSFDNTTFLADATHETLKRTKLGGLKAGDKVNLERALKLSDRLGGHLVTGHIDGLATVVSISKQGFSKCIAFACDSLLINYIVEKGSVAVDGVSLTIAGVVDSSDTFEVALIPHTLQITTIGELQVGDKVNIEVDLIAKYAAKWMAPMLDKNLKNAGLSLSFLTEHGYT